MRSASTLTLSFAILVSGCGQSPSTLTAHAPSTFTASQPSFGIVDLRWGAPSDSVDGYEIQDRIPPADWRPVSSGLIPSGVYHQELPLDPSVPERIDLDFRIRSAHGSSRSDWVNASVHHGISPPSSVVASLAADGGGVSAVAVGWENTSQVSTDLRLERAALDSSGDAGAFVDLSDAVFPSTTYLDPDEPEGNWQYRVSYGTQREWSTPIPSNVVAVILPPTGLVAHQIDGGVQLDWVPRSLIATSQSIERVDYCAPCATQTQTVAILPGDARSYVDPDMAPWPVVVYRVTAQTDAGAASSPLAVLGQVHVAGAFPLTGTAATTPAVGEIVRTDQGLLHGVANTLPLTYYRDTGSGWEAFTPPETSLNVGFFADLAGHPHALYTTGPPSSPQTSLVHAWHDGSAWLTETVPTPGSFARGLISPSGVVHVLTQRLDSSDEEIISYTVGTAGAFSSRDLVPSLLPSPAPSARWLCDEAFAVGSDETDWVAFACPRAEPPFQTYYELFHRRPDGTWTEELAPFMGDHGGVLLAAGTGEAAALYAPRSSPPNFHLHSAAGWGPGEDASLPVLPGGNAIAIALAPDEERVAVAVESQLTGYPPHPTPNPPPLTGGFGVWLWERSASGWTLASIGGPYDVYDTRPFLKRGASGKLVLTMTHVPTVTGLPNTSIYVEDP